MSLKLISEIKIYITKTSFCKICQKLKKKKNKDSLRERKERVKFIFLSISVC